jgi:hypothetical protein
MTPMSISVAVGDHAVTVRISGPGWNPDTRTVTIVSGNNDLSVTLLPIVTAGPSGPPGANGTSVTFVGYFDGGAHGCPNGGAVYRAGAVETYVCNGMNGTNGSGRRASGPCFDNINRYVDCGNGTVTDTVTGLIWLKNAYCLGSLDWATANQTAAGLKTGDCGGTLTDGSSPGDWRLPTKEEWAATISHAVSLGCTSYGSGGPTLTNDAGTACYTVGPTSFASVLGDFFWSSNAIDFLPVTAAMVRLDIGTVNYHDKTSIFPVWPVRGGPR